ncbi:MAG: hypothetical protein HY749_06230 [Gammaproteobacteria bacterium]|nr:hypothetical protein [Gammaproteobacteria bacterium]MBI5618634.1 hypothetical protein [Gammaproteobacteria bacterium]
MSDYRLAEGLFLAITPAGAYYAVSRDEPEPLRTLLLALLAADVSPPLDEHTLFQLASETGESDVAALLHRAQRLALIQGETMAVNAPVASLEMRAPALIAELSGLGRAVLAEADGFYVARADVPHEAAEEISALSADLSALITRHRGLLSNNLNLGADAWGALDAAGNSTLGIWPLYVGGKRFALAILGEPRLNRPGFTELIWLLVRRYGHVQPDADELVSRSRASYAAHRLSQAHDEG